MNLQLTILYIFSFLADVLRYKSIFLLPSWWLFFLSSSVCQYHFVFIHQSCVKSLNEIAEFFCFQLKFAFEKKRKNAIRSIVWTFLRFVLCCLDSRRI